MKFTVPFLTALAIVPTAADAWSLTPYGRALMSISPAQILRQQQELLKEMDQVFDFNTNSPSYDIVNNEEKFEVSLDVPGVPPENINVNLDKDSRMLTISGEREDKSDRYYSASKFSQSFSLDPSVDIDKFNADLKNGVLVITAPKDMKKIEESMRKIPVNVLKGGTESKVMESSKTEKIPVN